MNYKNANDKLQGRCKDSRKIANNTYLKRRGQDIAVMLHETDIVIFHPNNTFTLNSGGYRTRTTKARMNSFSPVNLNQVNGVWYIDKFLFEDGMKVNSKGAPINGKNPAEFEKSKRKIDRLTAQYIKGFVNDIKENGLQTPNGGDCWYCAMKNEDGEPLGDLVNDTHLLNHFEDGYFVPSLLYNAIMERGYNEPSFIWHMIKDNPEMATHELRAYFRKRKTNLTKMINNGVNQ
mgnify:FL=1